MSAQYWFGKKALLDAINNHLPVEMVYLTKNNFNLIKELEDKDINYQLVNNNWFNKFDQSLNHQGIAFSVSIKQPLSAKQTYDLLKQKSESIVLIVDSIEDPRNFGAILRTCDAFNIDAVFYKKNHQVEVNDLVNKTSMGATNYLNLCEVANLNQVVQNLKDLGYWVYATTLNDKAVTYSSEKYPAKVAVIVGNENNGISPLLIKSSDMSIYIPMYGHVQSLNVSVATGIVLSYLKIKKTQ